MGPPEAFAAREGVMVIADKEQRNSADEEFPTPYLGRTVRIVGSVENVDPKQTPHPMNQRGELGKALYNWRHNTVSNDPITRIVFENHCSDRAHVFTSAMRRVPKGSVNPDRTPVPDPAVMSRHIKKVAGHLGLDVVGIGRSHPSFLYAGKSLDSVSGEDGEPLDTPERLARQLPFVIAGTVAWNYDMTKAHRHRIGDAAYDFTGQQTNLILSAIEGHIRDLGYHTLRGAMNGQAAALACGIGELGRNGMIITEKFGARVHASDAIMTDLPLEPDKPLDIGVDAFCKICRKCATTCPTNSITFGEKAVENGVEKYKINWLTCYKLRPYVAEHWVNCLTCIAVCPFTKPDTWWHATAIRTLRWTPPRLRSAPARALKWLDDRFWGVVPNKRVRWLGYDSGVKPGELACTVAGCTAPHGEAAAVIAESEIGYYAPLKENTNRFFKRG
jgi:reductive dehalogenase